MSESVDVNTENLDQDNISMVIDVMLNGLIIMPKSYTTGFTEYLQALSDEKTIDPWYAKFWEFLIISHMRFHYDALEEIHNSWVEECSQLGWTFNTTFDAEAKTCPLLINFHNLSLEENCLVRYFAGISWALVLKVESTSDDPAEAE